jgi:hypothetical protein
MSELSGADRGFVKAAMAAPFLGREDGDRAAMHWLTSPIRAGYSATIL